MEGEYLMGKPDIWYEQYKLGEIDPDKKRELETDPDLQRELARLESDDQAILKAYPAAEMAEAIRRKAHSDARASGENIRDFRYYAVRYALPTAAAAAICLFLVFTFADLLPSRYADPVFAPLTGNEDTRIKGEDQATLRIYRRDGAEVRELEHGAAAGEGDQLQVSYFTPTRRYGAIFSLDGTGYLTLHYPAKGTETVLLEGGGEHFLPFAVELDNAPSYERFYLVYSDAPIKLTELARMVKTAAPDDLEGELADKYGKSGAVGVFIFNVTKR